MKNNWTGVLKWFVLYYILQEPLRGLLLNSRVWNPDFTTDLKSLVLTTTSIIPFAFFSVLGYLTFYYGYKEKKWLLFSIMICLSSIVPIVFRYFLQEVCSPLMFGFRNYQEGYGLINYFQDNMYFAINFKLFGIIFFFIQHSRYTQKREKELSIANQKMELSLLRSQINPHFLLNSLNNIYSLVFNKSENALDALEKLSEMLKYTLYQNKEKVTVSDEMRYIDKYLGLQKLRLDYEPNIELNIDHSCLQILIPQFIILGVLENAVKHGDLRINDDPVILSIKSTEERISIYSKNKIRPQIKDSVGGIGLDNLIKRLELLYPDSHEIKISSDDDHFTISINIPTND